MEYKTSMTEGVIWKKMLVFCVPLILGNLFQQLYSTIDSVIVGKLVGKEALGAIGSCDPIITFTLGLCIGASAGAGVIIAQFYGAKNERSLRTAVHTTIALGAILGVILEIAGIVMVPTIMRWINTPEDVFPVAVLYLQVYFGGLFFTVVFNMASAILNGCGNSQKSVKYLVISSFVNIVLDLLFVVVFKWGVFGAAFATLLSQLVSCVLIMMFLFKCDELYKVDFKAITAEGQTTKDIIKLGLPTAIQNMVRSGANIMVQATVNSFGTLVMAGYAAYIRIDGINWLPLMSLGMAASTFTGQNIGAGQFDRVKKGIGVSVGMSVVYTLFTGVLLIAFREPVIGIFTDDPGVVKFGIITLLGYIPLYWIFAAYTTLTGTLSGAGKTFAVMVISILTQCIFRVVWILVITRVHNTFWMLLCMLPVSWFLGVLAALIYMAKTDWMKQE